MKSNIPGTLAQSEDAQPGELAYIVDPRSGDIYTRTHGATASQRFPFSVPELVDISPFIAQDEKNLICSGRKRTFLLVVDIRTGVVEANACNGSSPLEDTKVVLQQTDYDLAIHTFSTCSLQVQRLGHTMYSPEFKTANASDDDTDEVIRIESLPDGAVFGTKNEASLWRTEFGSTAVGIFEVLKTPNGVLLARSQAGYTDVNRAEAGDK
ncbi:hypothetical protein MIND_01188600 [Mycena indigotica]|uniref:Uncharacterized protein n=1 Tax=Mycena indigotica TaxID=2126181 RepID=A0A8H6S4A2_9AGAR|nr:uncharacterized protein MIND_01188600 [Mycena indigotica]KAF7292895.1 hypothetical protein MIND_01188600 [Mycena indigotica]